MSFLLCQCYKAEAMCDGQKDCVNGDDEGNCAFDQSCDYLTSPPPPPPAVIHFTRRCCFINETGLRAGSSSPCPHTHYQCPDHGYCLPVYTRCNEVYDCPFHEDEADCGAYKCPGYFRCRASTICLHHDHVCDGMYHCPQADDEFLCDLYCPVQCTCLGLAFTCPDPFPAHLYPHLRYLNGRDSGMSLKQLAANVRLVYLSLASCGLMTHVANVSLPNVNVLDLSHNAVSYLAGSIEDMPSLKVLFLSHNPLSAFLRESGFPRRSFLSVQVLSVSGVSLPTLNDRLAVLFPNTRVLNLSQCGSHSVLGRGLQPMTHLRELDMTGCPMTEVNEGVLQGLTHLRTVYADNYKVCCAAALLEGFSEGGCQSPRDEISSCADLLRSGLYRVVLAIFAVFTILGNLGSLAFRLRSIMESRTLGFSVFVLSLCASDFLMGLYLAVIGITDRVYESNYVWQDALWRQSFTCKMAGFLSLLSSEVSAFIVCLITLDRFLVVRFPLSFLHFKGRHALLASGLSWLVGGILAGVPFSPRTAHWHFYSQTGICVPLPVTRKQFAGHDYAFAVMIVLNFILFLVIAVGQAAIFYSVRSNRLGQKQTGRESQDADLARRLFTIAVSDFLCWFPIGLLGLLAANGVPVPGEVNVAMAIIVLPFNSAINPFLYTLNVLLDKRRRAKEDRLLKWIESQT